MLLSLILLSASVVLLASPVVQGQLVSNCITARCPYCREVLQMSTGQIQSGCLAVAPLVTGNEGNCDIFQPLLVNTTTGLVEAFCGSGPGRIECPHGFQCKVDPVDRFAICCLVPLT